MLNFELCDLMVLLDGKHKADFEEMDDAQAYGYLRVDCGYAEVCDVVNRWTGEVRGQAITVGLCLLPISF